MLTLEERFEQYEDEFLKFERVMHKLSTRPDLHAFMLLDGIVPGNEDEDEDIVSDAQHDEIFLSTVIELLNDKVTDDQIKELVRCGVRYDSEHETWQCLFKEDQMFVGYAVVVLILLVAYWCIKSNPDKDREA